MQPLLTLIRRELGSHFVSLSGYVIIAAVVFLLGQSFTNLITGLLGASSEAPVTVVFYNTQYFWLIILLSAPVITMRTFAHEKSAGTYETLMTAPVGDLTVVLAKFTGSIIFFGIVWLPLLACLLIVRHYISDPTQLNVGVTASTFFGIFLVGCVYMSMGCYASSLTNSQAVAAVVSLGMGIGLFMLGFLAMSYPMPTTFGARTLNHVSMINHLQDFTRGVVDTRALAFYLAVTVFFLFLTLKSVESRRWK